MKLSGLRSVQVRKLPHHWPIRLCHQNSMRYKNVLYSPDPPYIFGELGGGGGLCMRLLHVMCTSSVVQSTSVGNLISVHAGVQVLVVAAIGWTVQSGNYFVMWSTARVPIIMKCKLIY